MRVNGLSVEGCDKHIVLLTVERVNLNELVVERRDRITKFLMNERVHLIE